MSEDLDLREIVQSQKKILDALARMESEDPDRPPKIGERIADAIVKFVGSWKFIILQAALLAGWFAFNLTAFVSPDLMEAKSVILVNFLLSVQAAFAAPLILMAQNRSDAKDRRRAIDAYRTVVHIEDLMEDLHRKLEKKKNGNGSNGGSQADSNGNKTS